MHRLIPMTELENIRKIICLCFAVTTEQLLEKNREEMIRLLRQFGMYYSFQYFNVRGEHYDAKRLYYSLAEIGSVYGKDHATVKHTVSTINNLLKTHNPNCQQVKVILEPYILSYIETGKIPEITSVKKDKQNKEISKKYAIGKTTIHIVNHILENYTNLSKNLLLDYINLLTESIDSDIRNSFMNKNADKPEKKDNKPKTFEDQFNERYLKQTFSESVCNLIRVDMPVYEKVMGIIRLSSKFEGWHNLTLVPEEMMIKFVNQADQLNEIEFDFEDNISKFRYVSNEAKKDKYRIPA